MKAIVSYLIALGTLLVVEQASGQDNSAGNKLRNDPTYSTHNYKHSNKAAAARKWESNRGVVVKSPVAGGANVANYKRQTPNQAPAGGITIYHIPSTDVADRNYKMQRPNQSTGSSGSGVADKRKNRADSTTTVGD
ncbi:MAG TPA: hypothetical protein VK404_00665 [Spirosoma sp.]|nr:hypothetical protein [Spirosoma sp.]